MSATSLLLSLVLISIFFEPSPLVEADTRFSTQQGRNSLFEPVGEMLGYEIWNDSNFTTNINLNAE